MNTLEMVSHETMVFMRGKYRLDEIGDGKDELKFKQGQKTVLTIYIHEDKYTFLIIFGKKEREIFELQRENFSKYICDYYDNAKTFHDGKWMFIDVTSMEHLEEVKKLIQIKKKPNRKPFSKENALYSMCGQRCDLCIHYTGTTDEQRAVMEEYLVKMWGTTDWSMSYFFKTYLTTFHGTYNKRTAMTGPIGSMARDYGDSPDFTHSV